MLLFDYCIANLTHAHVIAGRPRGFGHIDFKSEELAKKAISVLNGVMLQGRELRVDLAQRRDAGAVGTPFAPRSFGSESDARPPRREKFQSSAGPRDQVRRTSHCIPSLCSRDHSWFLFNPKNRTRAGMIK